MSTTLESLANLVHGTLVGDGTLRIDGAATLRDAAGGEISLLDKAERLKELEASKAVAVVTPRDLGVGEYAAIQVDDVHAAFATIVAHYHPPQRAHPPGISPSASIDPTAVLGHDVTIHPLAVIGPDVKIGDRTIIHGGVQLMAGCEIGDDVTVFPNAVLYEETVVGPRSVIHAGAVLGAYGFGYDSSSGRHVLSAQLGRVVVEADVEIGANTTIDRGTYGPTVVGEGTKIDNQVQVAHNCRLGKHNLLCAQVGIAGSTTTGDYVVMAGQVGIRDHVHIGSGVVLGAMSGVMNDVPDGARMLGIPATPEREQATKQVALSKLPEMRRQWRRVQALVDRWAAEEEAARKSDAA